MALRYRMATEADTPQLKELWSRYGGWNEMTDDFWQQLVLAAPLGAEVTVVEDSEDEGILGQLMVIHSRVYVSGDELEAARPFAFVLSPPLRGPRAFTAGPGLYEHAAAVLRQRGIRLLYMLPDPLWRIWRPKGGGFQTGSFPLFSRALPLEGPVGLPPGYAVGEPPAWDEHVDDLSTRSARIYGCTIVRNARTLKWKIGRGDYTVTAVERRGELAALVASRRKGDRQWLICDVLAADARDSLDAALAAALELADREARRAPPDEPLEKAGILATPLLEPALHRLGFSRDSYEFPMFVHVLDERIRPEDVAPGRWYVSAND